MQLFINVAASKADEYSYEATAADAEKTIGGIEGLLQPGDCVMVLCRAQLGLPYLSTGHPKRTHVRLAPGAPEKLLATVSKAPINGDGDECHSVWHQCGRKLGTNSEDSFAWKHDEFIVYNDGGKQQVYPEWVIIYRRKNPVLREEAWVCRMREAGVWHRVQLKVEQFSLTISNVTTDAPYQPTTER